MLPSDVATGPVRNPGKAVRIHADPSATFPTGTAHPLLRWSLFPPTLGWHRPEIVWSEPMDEETVITDGELSPLEELLRYLDRGWVIDPPVLVRPTWYLRSAARDTYHFVLKHDGQCVLVSVPECAAIEQFVAGRGLTLSRM